MDDIAKETSMNRDLESILLYLYEKTGIDFSGYRSGVIEQRIMKRIKETGHVDYHEYLVFLRGSAEELRVLIDTLTINVSGFFREALTFEYIAKKVLPTIVSHKTQLHEDSISVWSAGCARGEEPYSIAIMLDDFLKRGDADLAPTIFATDIDVEAIDKALVAAYPFESVKDLKYRFLRNYFIEEGEKFIITPEVKGLVCFSIYNILDRKTFAPPESVFGGFDMIFCRNVLIYLLEEYQEIVFDKIYHALAEKGYLVLGETERPAVKFEARFKRRDACCPVFQKR